MKKLEADIYKALTGKATIEPVAFQLDQETIQRIGAIVWTIVQEFQKCKKTPETATPSVNSPSVTEVKVVKKAVKQELGFFKNLVSGGKYVKAVLESGKKASVEDVREAFVRS